MFDAKKTAEELVKTGSANGTGWLEIGNRTVFIGPEGKAQSLRESLLIMLAAALSQAKAGGIAEGWKQMKQAAAKVARERAEHHRGYCPTTCRCADGWHIAAAIESLPLEPQPLETKGTDNGG